MITFDCPRCTEPATARTYGPCKACRIELSESQFHIPTAFDIKKASTRGYVPKMNVVPNQIATKE